MMDPIDPWDVDKPYALYELSVCGQPMICTHQGHHFVYCLVPYDGDNVVSPEWLEMYLHDDGYWRQCFAGSRTTSYHATRAAAQAALDRATKRIAMPRGVNNVVHVDFVRRKKSAREW